MLVIVVVHDEVAGRSRGRFARATQSSPAPSRRWSMADAVGDVSATGSGPSERAVPVDDAGASTPPRDVFSSAEFDAVDFLNRLFPDETSLTGVDALVAKLRLRVRRVDDEILEAVRSQSTGGVRAKADLAQAQTAILELGARIRDIKDKAELSETMVQEICRDIKKLDRAKRHLTGTITALRRLSMLVSAVDQLETMAMRRQYHDSANLLEAVNQLSAHFDGYNDVPKVAELQRKYAKIRAALRANVFEEFHATWQPSVIEQDPGAAPRLADACLVVNALEPHVREELVGNLTNKELTAYAQVFDGSFGEQSNLDAVERRYAWIKRNLKAKEEMWGVFPPHWRVPQLLCMSLCKLTRTHLLEILDAPGPKEVQTTLQALHRTIEFERDMDDYFRVDAGADEGADESADFDAEDGVSAGQVRAKYERLAKEAEVAKQRGGRALPMDSAAAALANASFKGVIASSFEDHMGPYVELEERQLMEFLDALVAEETWGKRADESTEGSSTPARAIPAATHASRRDARRGARLGRPGVPQHQESVQAVFEPHARQGAVRAARRLFPRDSVVRREAHRSRRARGQDLIRRSRATRRGRDRGGVSVPVPGDKHRGVVQRDGRAAGRVDASHAGRQLGRRGGFRGDGGGIRVAHHRRRRDPRGRRRGAHAAHLRRD